jgi:hypothetical protein
MLTLQRCKTKGHECAPNLKHWHVAHAYLPVWRSAALPFNKRRLIAGSTNSVRIVEVIRPPMTTMASGF